MTGRLTVTGLVAALVVALAVPTGAFAAEAAGSVEAAGTAVAAPSTSTDRIAGADRYETALEISRAAYPEGAPVVFVVTGASYPDALSAGPAAALQGGPLLLTPTDALSVAIAQEIERLAPARIVVVGGPSSVSSSVLGALKKLAPEVRRVDGDTRYSTSLAVADFAFGDGADTAYVATGATFPDALSAGAAAGFHDAPVVLVDGAADTVDAATGDLVTRLGVDRVVIAGGPASVSPAVEAALGELAPTERIGGADRYEASTALNRDGFAEADRAFLVTGVDFPDALAGSAWAGSLGAPLYAVPGDCVPAGTLDALEQQGVTQVTLLGGSATLSDDVAALKACAQTAPVRVPLRCDTLLTESTAEALVGTDLTPVAAGGTTPLQFADQRAGALSCGWTAPPVSATIYPRVTLTIVPDVSADDYGATADGEWFSGSPSIPGHGPDSREQCRVVTTSPSCGLVDLVGDYGVRLTIVTASGSITDDTVARARALFDAVTDATAGAGEPGPLWQPYGPTVAGATSCDGLIGLEQLGEIVSDPTVHEYRSYEGEYALATFRSNQQVGGYGCGWVGEAGPDILFATVLPGGAGYFPQSTPVSGGSWVPASGYPGEAWISEAGDEISVLVDNAWFDVRALEGGDEVLPELMAAVVENVTAAN